HQVAIIYALTNGYLDGEDLPQLKAWERDFHVYLRTQHPQVLDAIRTSKTLGGDTETGLKAAIERYAELFADPHSPVGTDDYHQSPILQETDANRRMSEEQLRMSSKPETNAQGARQSY
ncbi:MAG: hypothetical protein ABW277_04500, partial [Longimicrobiaceae bacterium]